MSVLVGSLLVALIASSAAAERLPLRTYTTEDGLAHARVRRIVSDPRGFLWFCTIDGLSRFDGEAFVTYRTGDGLPDPWITDLLPARDGTYWVATNDGVARFDAAGRLPDDGRGPGGQRLCTVLPAGSVRGAWDTASGSRPAGGSCGAHLGWRARRPVRAGSKQLQAYVPAGRSGPGPDGHVAARRRRGWSLDWNARGPVPSIALWRGASGRHGRARRRTRGAGAGVGHAGSALGRPRRGAARAGARCHRPGGRVRPARLR